MLILEGKIWQNTFDRKDVTVFLNGPYEAPLNMGCDGFFSTFRWGSLNF